MSRDERPASHSPTTFGRWPDSPAYLDFYFLDNSFIFFRCPIDVCSISLLLGNTVCKNLRSFIV